jgi:hypothetical protein
MNKEERRWYNRLYRIENREAVLLVAREGMRQKRATDPAYCDRERAWQLAYDARKRAFHTPLSAEVADK